MRVPVVPAELKLGVAMGDCGINSGGGATAEPMLVHPPAMGVTVGAAARVPLMLGAMGFEVQLGATGAVLEFVEGVVQGEEGTLLLMDVVTDC